MKKNILGTGTIHRYSVFYTTFGLLMVLALVTVIFWGFFGNRLLGRQQQEKIQEAGWQQLSRAGEEVDLVFDVLSKSMRQSMWSADLISVMVNPDQVNPELGNRIVKLLQSHVSGNNLVDEALFYCVYSDTVYLSRGDYLKLDDYESRELITLATNQLSKTGKEDWTVFVDKGQVYLAVQLTLTHRLGIMVFRMDENNLYQVIQTENSGQNSIGVYTSSNEAVFPDRQLDEDAAAVVESGRISSLQEADQIFGQNNVYYSVTGARTHWLFLQKTGAVKNTLPLSAVIMLLLPSMIVYLLMSLAFAVYITRKVYAPINHLMQITLSSRGSGNGIGQAKNEVNYLEMVYTDTLQKNERYTELMQSVSRDLLEQILRSLISQRNISRKYVLDTLEGINRSDLSEGHYLVLAGLLSFPDQEEPTAVERGIYQRSIRQMLEIQDEEHVIMASFFRGDEVLVCALHFSSADSVISVKRKCADLLARIRKNLENLPYSLILGSGKLCSDFMALGSACQEAMEAASYARYDQKAGETPEIQVEQKGGYEKKYFSEQMQYVIELVEKGHKEDADKTRASLLQELHHSAREITELRQIYEAMGDVLMEKWISYRVHQENDEQAEVLQLSDRMTANELTAAMDQYIGHMLTLIGSYAKKNCFRYIEEARAIIGARYADSSLSLNDVSQTIGISGQYLSSLFSELTGENFLTYLNQFRVEQAKLFLKSTGLTVREVGFKCGFNSLQSFSRVFKKYTDKTPSQYRGEEASKA